MAANQGAVIVISSHVARGSVGNRAMLFALERLGFTVWAVPTIVLPFHPGHGPGPRIVPVDRDFEALLQTLVENHASKVAGIVSGYLTSPAQAGAVATVVRAVKAANPQAIYVCDPVIGDSGRLYVAEALANAMRDELLPLADAATPNAFEYSWLCGETEAALASSAGSTGRFLDVPVALVTSAPALMRGQIGNVLVHAGGRIAFEHPAVATTAKGTGDLLAALFLARRLQGHDWPQAGELAIASVYEIVYGTAGAGADELLLPALQQAIVHPRVKLSIRHLGARAAPRRPIEV